MRPTGDLMEEHRVIERMLNVVSKAADMLESGEPVEQAVFADATDFFKNFADKCHHGKEEALMFKKLIDRGVSGEVGPISVLTREHQDGRAHIRKIAELSAGEFDGRNRKGLILQIRGYVSLMNLHIPKEDNVLFPMANGILTPEDQEELMIGFEKHEQEVMGPGAHERYHLMIEEWEKKYL